MMEIILRFHPLINKCRSCLMQNRGLFVVVALSLLFVISSASNSHAQIYEITFSQSDIALSSDDYGDIVNIPGCHLKGEPGNPFLPVRTGHIAAPAGYEITGISAVNEVWMEIDGKFDIRPAPTPVPLSYEGPLPDVIRNQAVYGSSNAYPEQTMEFTGAGSMRGFSIGGFKINPLRYHPESGRVEMLERVSLQVDYAPGQSRFE
ncbi:MAG: hypothetical protein GF307_12785, partial [candidate division Zixibacteria bacterium]|nr:hypothetical protein [candidate division Zixibacteria bacterium]